MFSNLSVPSVPVFLKSGDNGNFTGLIKQYLVKVPQAFVTIALVRMPQAAAALPRLLSSRGHAGPSKLPTGQTVAQRSHLLKA